MDRKLPRNAQAKRPDISAGKLRLHSLRDLDGRTQAARTAFELRKSLILDAFGSLEPSTAQLCIIENIALLGCALQDLAARYLAGKGADMMQFATLANAQRRLLADIGLQRVVINAPIDLKAYIKAKAA